jgi:Na+/melibiose symporter-like transporter
LFQMLINCEMLLTFMAFLTSDSIVVLRAIYYFISYYFLSNEGIFYVQYSVHHGSICQEITNSPDSAKMTAGRTILSPYQRLHMQLILLIS